jgi:excisionase family DNA binding protein
MLTLGEAAAALAVPTETLRSAIRRGVLSQYTVAGSRTVYVRSTEILAWDRQRAAARADHPWRFGGRYSRSDRAVRP